MLDINLWLFITTLLYFVINGAGIYETLVLVPKWSANPPESLNIFKGQYTPDLKTFWIAAHGIHELSWIIVIILSWNIDSIRNPLIILFLIHFAVCVWTIMYFATNIIDFQSIANTGKAEPNLLARTTQWKNLNLIRTGLFLVISLVVAWLSYGSLVK
jgi:hypothetical protein